MTQSVYLGINFLLLALCCINTGTAKGIGLVCPDGSWPVNCLLDPCDSRIAPSCEAYPDAVCRSDYCGGCNARFFVGRREVTDMCQLPLRSCPIDGQVFQECRTCPATCEYPDLACPDICLEGCGCPLGQLIDEVTNRCVDPKQCKSPLRSCPIDGQVFQECRTCPATCENPDLLCPDICLKGCGCPFGQLIDEVNNRCVDQKQCKLSLEFGIHVQ